MSKAMTRSVLKEVQDFRDCVKRVVAMLSGKQIPVAERGNEAYVRYNRRGEPVLVNIPSIPDDASPTLMNAVRGFLDHEVAHRPECHQSAKEVAISMYGKFVGFPNDKIKKTRKVKTHEGSDGQN